MTRFVLSLLPDGAAILTTEAPLSVEEAAQIKHAYDGWNRDGGIAVIADCRVQHIDSIDLILNGDRLERVPA